MIKNRKQVDIVASLIMMAFAAAYYYVGSQLGAPHSGEPLGPAGFPKLLGFVYGALALVTLILALANKAKDGEKKPKLTGKDMLSLFLLAVLFVIYCFGIDYIGYAVSTFIFAGFSFWWMGARKPVQIVIVALCVTVFIYLVFGTIFRADLPSGILI